MTVRIEHLLPADPSPDIELALQRVPGNCEPQVPHRNDSFKFATVDDWEVPKFPRPHEIEGELGRIGRCKDVRIGSHDVTDGNGIRVQARGNYFPGDIAFRHDPNELAAFLNDHDRRNIVRNHLSRRFDRFVFRKQASKSLIADDIRNNIQRHEMAGFMRGACFGPRGPQANVHSTLFRSLKQ